MKCKHCDGDGVIVDVEYGHAGKYGCKYCDGKGVVEPLTNEEWFDGLSTEEKAKFLFEHGVIACNFCKGDCKKIDYKTSECKYNVSPSYSYTGIVMWLKQPHTKE